MYVGLTLNLGRAWSLLAYHVGRGVQVATQDVDVDEGIADAVAATPERAGDVHWRANADRKEARLRGQQARAWGK